MSDNGRDGGEILESREELRSTLQEIMSSPEWERRLFEFLDPLHPADIAEFIEYLDDEDRRRIILALPVKKAALTVEEMEPEVQSRILHHVSDQQAARILDEMSDDDIADLLGEISPQEAADILELLEDEEAADVQELLEYLRDSAGGIMTTDVMALDEELSAEEAIGVLRTTTPDAETVYYLYIINRESQLTGVLSLRELIVAPPSARLRELMNPSVISVQAQTDQEEVAKLVAKYDLLAVPVVDASNRLLGIITVDDVLDVIEEEVSEDFYRISGTVPHEGEGITVDMALPEKARRRLPWLMGLLIGHLFTGRVISEFEEILQSVVALAYFIPVLMDMGGNVGTQSLAMVVRGLATGRIHARRLVWAIFREAQTGLVLGAILGVSIAFISFIWQGSATLGLVVGISMAVTVFSAAVMGTFIPLFLDYIGIDSAVASGPFITTVIDIASLIIYFVLATIMLNGF